MIKKGNDGYSVDLRPQGRNGKRFRKKLKTHAEAMAFERHIMATYATAEPWQHIVDNRRLTDLIKTWFDLHGHHLKSGAQRRKELENAAITMGNPKADKFTAQDFTKFRADRARTVSANTANHDLVNFRSLFNELKRLGEWRKPSPVADIRKLRTDAPELSYLELDQIDALLAALDASPDSHARITARVCLATGARWGEACTLKASQVKNGKVTYNATKNGKSRSVPVAADIAQLVLDHAPLVDGANTFKRAVATLDFELPKGQMTHILRHTFASHFMINGGNIITLQNILGHGSLAMTVRYAHLSPDHLEEALLLNPLSKNH